MSTKNRIPNLGPASLPESPFHSKGIIYGLNRRLMAPFVCRRVSRPGDTINTYLSAVTIRALIYQCLYPGNSLLIGVLLRLFRIRKAVSSARCRSVSSNTSIFFGQMLLKTVKVDDVKG